MRRRLGRRSCARPPAFPVPGRRTSREREGSSGRSRSPRSRTPAKGELSTRRYAGPAPESTPSLNRRLVGLRRGERRAYAAKSSCMPLRDLAQRARSGGRALVDESLLGSRDSHTSRTAQPFSVAPAVCTSSPGGQSPSPLPISIPTRSLTASYSARPEPSDSRIRASRRTSFFTYDAQRARFTVGRAGSLRDLPLVGVSRVDRSGEDDRAGSGDAPSGIVARWHVPSSAGSLAIRRALGATSARTA
jgi:hypothetical protein